MKVTYPNYYIINNKLIKILCLSIKYGLNFILLINYRITHLNKLKDRPGTDQTLKLVNHNSYKEFMTK